MKTITLLVEIAVDDYGYTVDEAMGDLEETLATYGPAKWKTTDVLLPEQDGDPP